MSDKRGGGSAPVAMQHQQQATRQAPEEVLTSEELHNLVQVYIRETDNLNTVDGLWSALQKSNISVDEETLKELFLAHVTRSQTTERSSDAIYTLSCAGFISVCNQIKLLSIRERQVSKRGSESPTGGGSPRSNQQARKKSLKVAFGASSRVGDARPSIVERLLTAGELADKYAEEDLVEALRESQPPMIPHILHGEITSRAAVLEGLRVSGKATIPNFSMRAAVRQTTPRRTNTTTPVLATTNHLSALASDSEQGDGDSSWGSGHHGPSSSSVLRQYATLRKVQATPVVAIKSNTVFSSAGTAPNSPVAAHEVADAAIDHLTPEALQILAGLSYEEMAILTGVERTILRDKVALGIEEIRREMDPLTLYPYVEFAKDLEGLDEDPLSPFPVQQKPLRMYAIDEILQRVKTGSPTKQLNQLGLLASPLLYATLTPGDVHALLATDPKQQSDETGDIYDAEGGKVDELAPSHSTVTYGQLAEQELRQQRFESDLSSKEKTVLATLTACGVRPEDELECLKAFRTASALLFQRREGAQLRVRGKSFLKMPGDDHHAFSSQSDFDNTAQSPMSATTVMDPSDPLNRLSEKEIAVLEKLAAFEAHLFLTPGKAAAIEVAAEKERDQTSTVTKAAAALMARSARNRRKSHSLNMPTRRDSETSGNDPLLVLSDTFDDGEGQSDNEDHMKKSYPLLIGLRDSVAAFVNQQRAIEERVGMLVTTETNDPSSANRKTLLPSASTDSWRPTLCATLGSRHMEVPEESVLEGSMRSELRREESKPGKMYRNVQENRRRWDILRQLEEMKSRADEDRKRRVDEQGKRLATAFSPCDMPYEDYFFVPQLQHRPKKVPLFLKKTFSPIDSIVTRPTTASSELKSTSTSRGDFSGVSGDSSSVVVSLRSPHRYQTTLDRRGNKYYTDEVPASRRRRNSVYHHGVKLQHPFLRPLSPTSCSVVSADSRPPSRSHPPEQMPPAKALITRPLSSAMVLTPQDNSEAERRLRTHGHVGKKPLYPDGTVGCSLMRSAAHQRSQSTEPSKSVNNPTSSSPDGCGRRSASYYHSPPSTNRRPATPVPAGVQAIMNKFLNDAADINNSRPKSSAGNGDVKQDAKKSPAVHRLKGNQKLIGFNTM